MRIQTENMSFKNRWTISSSKDFQVHQQCSQRRCWFSQTALLGFEELPDMSPALPSAPSLVVGSPWLVASASSYSAGRQECPPRVRYSPEIDASTFALHILSDIPRGFQWVKYISLMQRVTLHSNILYWLLFMTTSKSLPLQIYTYKSEHLLPNSFFCIMTLRNPSNRWLIHKSKKVHPNNNLTKQHNNINWIWG